MRQTEREQLKKICVILVETNFFCKHRISEGHAYFSFFYKGIERENKSFNECVNKHSV